MLINIYKNWPDDVHIGNFGFMKQFMEMEKAQMDKNEYRIEKIGLLELEESSDGFIVDLGFLYFPDFLKCFMSY
jgi:hypothetical protein